LFTSPEAPFLWRPAVRAGTVGAGVSLVAERVPLTSIRGFAALWVLGSHFAIDFAQQWRGTSAAMMHAGFMGVDVFFVLSGFILAIVYQGLALPGVPRFLLKRALRVYPLNFAVIAAIAMLSTTVPVLSLLAKWRTLPWYALMVQAYLPKPILAWDSVTWSVGMELACYLCFPFAILGLRRLGTLSLAILGAALLGATYLEQRVYLGAFWGWPALVRGMAGFWPGVVLGTLALRLPPVSARRASLGELICLAGLVFAVWAGALRLVPLFAAGLILFLFFDRGVLARGLRARWCHWLGEISFSIYLIHGLVLPALNVWAWELSFRIGWTAALPIYAALYLAAVLILSDIAWRTIEVPGRNLARIWSRPRAEAPGPIRWNEAG
jgi:peptidoglycan/LPS O-acetylase OafA/YrhL